MRQTNSATRPGVIDYKGHGFDKDIILTCVRWYKTTIQAIKGKNHETKTT